MGRFSAVTDIDLTRARSDQAFRQKLLTQSLEALLDGMKRLRRSGPSPAGGGAKQLREGVELAVRLAELIQHAGGQPPRF
jgi:hypothetical protein